MSRPSSKRARLALGSLSGIVAVAGGLALAGAHRADPAAAAARPDQPNIVLIQSDDQTRGELSRQVMPTMKRDLISRGTKFTNYMVTTGECCPSRASLITGQYAHDNGVTSNQVGYEGLRGKQDVLPAWLKKSGYRTMHVGAKYLNGYREAEGKRVAPGWSHWFTVLSHTQYYKYLLSNDGHRERRGDRPRDYVGRVLGKESKKLIHRYAPARRPFYLQLDTRAPHVSRKDDPFGPCDSKAIPDKRDEGAFAHAPLPQPPSYDEQDMSDKPAFLRAIPPIGSKFQDHLTSKWRCALDSLVSVDRNVGQVYNAVKKEGELGRTVFVFISDNGLFFGEHRLVQGKVFPYEEAIHMPLVMRVPERYRGGAPRVRRSSDLVANIDLAPTILDLAHARPCVRGKCRTMDGRSLMPLLTGKGHWPRGRALLNEYRVGDLPRYSTCKFAALRTRREIYVEHYRVVNPKTGECRQTLQKERYDLKRDPFELDNRCFGGAADSCPHDTKQNELERRLQDLRECAGIKGRDKQVGNRPFCE
jgi:N-acetylglucosamine-6-sulfatase